MKLLEFEDSEMLFSFQAEEAFHIEKSRAFASLGPNIKICEAVVRRQELIYFIEAKKSFPNSYNPDKFSASVEDIVEKFRCSWSIFTGLLAGRPFKSVDPLPAELNRAAAGHLWYSCIVILRDHPLEVLHEVKDAINQAVSNKERRLFCIQDFIVLNGKKAKELGIIKDFTEIPR